MALGVGYSFNPSTIVGGTKVRDLSGRFYHGTISGSAALVTGKTGYGDGLHCAGGAMSTVLPADTYPIVPDAGFAVAAWVKLDDNTATARCIASTKNGSGTLVWALYASNGTGDVSANILGTTYTATGTSIRDGNWHHVMLSCDRLNTPNVIRLIVDGVKVFETTGTVALAYSGGATLEAGRNTVGATEPLNGIVDDLRWWANAVDLASWPAVMNAEMTDFQLAIYPFDDTSSNDYSVYNRDLSTRVSATFVDSFYGKGLKSTAAEAGATGVIDLPACDRLELTGYLRLDVAPTGTAKPILNIVTSSDADRLRVLVNLDRTITATWVTLNYGTLSVTSAAALTVGQWSRFSIGINPNFIDIRLNSNTAQQTSTGNSIPNEAVQVDGLYRLYVGGDATVGGQVTFDYLTLTKNYLDVPRNGYWTGPPVWDGSRPGNTPRGIYVMNENAGTTIGDQSPYGNHITMQAGGSWMTGHTGASALHCTGNGASAKSTTLAWSAVPTGWAYSVWGKPRASTSGTRWVVMRDASNNPVAQFGRESGALWWRIYGAGGTTSGQIIFSNAISGIADEVWTHHAASYNGDTFTFFINGVKIAQSVISIGALLQPTQIDLGEDSTRSLAAVGDLDDFVLFDTPVSESNVLWMYQNPESMALAFPVTSTRSTTWNIKAPVASTRSATWDTRATVTATRSTSWDVRTQVASSRNTTWDTRSQVTSSRTASWAVKAAVTALRSTSWDTRAAVTSTRSTTWNVQVLGSQVTSTRSTIWDVRVAVSTARSALWDTRARVTSTRATTWSVESDSTGYTPVTNPVASVRANLATANPRSNAATAAARANPAEAAL